MFEYFANPHGAAKKPELNLIYAAYNIFALVFFSSIRKLLALYAEEIKLRENKRNTNLARLKYPKNHGPDEFLKMG